MAARIVTAVVGVPVAVALILWSGGLSFTIAVGLVALIGTGEFYSGVRKMGARPVEWAGFLAVIVFTLSAHLSDIGQCSVVSLFSLSVILILSLMVELLRSRRAPVINIGATMFGAVYVGWLLSHIVSMHRIVGRVTVGSLNFTAGACLVMYVFLCTWTCDTLAYFVGKFYGRTKLAPRLSPAKTVEGFVAGLVGSVLAAVIFGALIKLPVGHSLVLGLLFGLLGQLGDLSESAIKREIGIKDFGSLFPGHGGVLDRFDSLLFTGTAGYYYAIYFLRGWS
ncbi:MAG: phosphatidate cytidylyltransferase [Armatimonadota bacterium]